MRFLTVLAAAISFAIAAPSFAATLGEDGLHKTDWMRNDTFKEMAEDLAEANSEGKRLLIMWEQRGCIYCTKMHEDVLPREDIDAFIRDNYFVVQLNLFGDVEVTDFDGEVLPEKQMAMKWGVMFTPTLMFFPPEVSDDVTAREAAVVNMPGAFGAETMWDLLNWVVEEGYLGEENFQKYHARKFNARQAAKQGGGD